MESLDENLFFNTLRSTFQKRFQAIIDHCYHVCIPINGSYDVRQLNDKFITSHILKPSPLLRSYFLPYNSKQNFQVQIENDFIKVHRGFGDHRSEIKIQILKEEHAYNSENKRYSLFLCEKPLISPLNNRMHLTKKQSTEERVKKNTELISFEECENFLKQISETKTEILQNQIKQLIRTYIILPEFLEDVALRLKKLIDFFIEDFRNDIIAMQPNYPKELLLSTIESYSIGLMYEPLIDLIKKKMIKEDELFMAKISMIPNKDLKPTNFGAQKAFENFDISDLVVEKFSDLENLKTPLSKLNCLKQILEVIVDRLKQTVDEHHSPFFKSGEKIFIMSDDLIASVICVLARCKPKYFGSIIKFIHSFSWYLPQNSELGHSLVTFEVAKEYIVNYTGDNRNQSSKSSPINQQQNPESPIKTPHRAKKEYRSALDQEIEKISKLIEEEKIYDTQESLPKNFEDEDLGGFIGSLANNFMTFSGQKR